MKNLEKIACFIIVIFLGVFAAEQSLHATSENTKTLTQKHESAISSANDKRLKILKERERVFSEVGKVCLKENKCIRGDFKENFKVVGSTGRLLKACDIYVSNKKDTPNYKSYTGYCSNYLRGFIAGLHIDTLNRLKKGEESGSFCFVNYPFDGPSAPRLAQYFLQFVGENPEMFRYRVDYVIYRMLEKKQQECQEKKQ